MFLKADQEQPNAAPGAAKPWEQWFPIQPGLRRLRSPRGPWFQFRDMTSFEWNTYELMIYNLPAALSGFRILQIADVHCRNYWTPSYDLLIDRVRADPPDLILFSGDILEDKHNHTPPLPTIRRFINPQKSPLAPF